MRALPKVLDARHDAQVVIVGGDDVSYGGRPKDGGNWRRVLLDEIGGLPERVHFTGRVSYGDFVRLAQVSSVHAYLTYPFVLSWSMLEVMACGGFVVGSETAPVQEVIEDGKNGWLVDFFDHGQIAARLIEALRQSNDVEHLREAARQTVLDRYNLKDCLSAQFELIDGLVSVGE